MQKKNICGNWTINMPDVQWEPRQWKTPAPDGELCQLPLYILTGIYHYDSQIVYTVPLFDKYPEDNKSSNLYGYIWIRVLAVFCTNNNCNVSISIWLLFHFREVYWRVSVIAHIHEKLSGLLGVSSRALKCCMLSGWPELQTERRMCIGSQL